MNITTRVQYLRTIEEKAAKKRTSKASNLEVVVSQHARELTARAVRTRNVQQNYSLKHIAVAEQYVSTFKDSLKSEACRAGCSHCCILRVPVLPIELFAIAQSVRESDKFEYLIKHINGVASSIRSTNFNNLQVLPVPCSLLMDGKCTVHSVRPMNCGKHSSIDSRDCEHPLGRQDNLQNPLRREVYTRMQLSQAKTIKDIGLDMVAVELNLGLSKCLAEENLEDRWFSGEVGLFKNEELTNETAALRPI